MPSTKLFFHAKEAHLVLHSGLSPPLCFLCLKRNGVIFLIVPLKKNALSLLGSQLPAECKTLALHAAKPYQPSPSEERLVPTKWGGQSRSVGLSVFHSATFPACPLTRCQGLPPLATPCSVLVQNAGTELGWKDSYDPPERPIFWVGHRMFYEVDFLFKFTKLTGDQACLNQHCLSPQLNLNAQSGTCGKVLHGLNEDHPCTEIISWRCFNERQVIVAHSRPDSLTNSFFKCLNYQMQGRNPNVLNVASPGIFILKIVSMFTSKPSPSSKQLRSTKIETESRFFVRSTFFVLFCFLN